jgi:seryl-tRNA synthetase
VIDPQLLRENPDLVRASQELRGASVGLVDEALEADVARRSAISAFENLRAEQNVFGKQVAQAPKDEKAALVAQAQELAARVKEAQRVASEAETRFTEVAGSIPNIVIDGVPAGGEDDFVTLREVGAKAAFDFEPRDHLAIGELLDAIDMERGAKVSGARFYFL